MRFSVIAWLDKWAARKIGDFMASVELYEIDEMADL